MSNSRLVCNLMHVKQEREKKKKINYSRDCQHQRETLEERISRAIIPVDSSYMYRLVYIYMFAHLTDYSN